MNGSHRKAEVAKFISYKTDFKSKTVSRDKESHYIVIKCDTKTQSEQMLLEKMALIDLLGFSHTFNLF